MATDLRHDGQKDPETLEREIDQTRAAMNRTLDALERKLSPGQLLDQFVSAIHGHGGEVASNLGKSVKQNPTAMMLTAIGLAWMILSPDRGSTASAYGVRRSQEGGEGLTERLSGAGEKIKDRAEGARSRLESSKEAFLQNVGVATQRAQAQARRAREGFNFVLEEQPLVLGAIGIAVGAAIGTALPPTEQENRLMGRVRDKTVVKLREGGVQAYEQTRETVSESFEQRRERESPQE